MTPTILTIRGESRSMLSWSRQPGAAPYSRIVHRLRRGWPAEAAVFADNMVRPRGGKKKRIRIVGINRPSRAGNHITRKRPPVILAPNPRVPNLHPPCLGGYRAWPIEALPVLRRVA